MFQIEVKSSNFPVGGPTGKISHSMTKTRLLWAAITVGKPNKAALKQFGMHSKQEAVFRWNMVLSALDFTATPGAVRNSALFDAMDQTEKGNIDYYLGMVFLKVFAHDLLKTPWLMHFSWLKKLHTPGPMKGKSAPDLVGFNPQTGIWGVYEAKCLNNYYSKSVMADAKKQANQLVTVDTSQCSPNVGSLLYRDGMKRLRFAWADPVPDSGPQTELLTTRETWQEYYGLAYKLYLEQAKNRYAFADEMGFKISMHRTSLRLAEAVLSRDGDFSRELGQLKEWSTRRMAEPRNGHCGDGIMLALDARFDRPEEREFLE